MKQDHRYIRQDTVFLKLRFTALGLKLLRRILRRPDLPNTSPDDPPDQILPVPSQLPRSALRLGQKCTGSEAPDPVQEACQTVP